MLLLEFENILILLTLISGIYLFIASNIFDFKSSILLEFLTSNKFNNNLHPYSGSPNSSPGLVNNNDFRHSFVD